MFINTSNLNLHYHNKVIDGFYSMFRADVELYRSDAMLDFEEIDFELEEWEVFSSMVVSLLPSSPLQLPLKLQCVLPNLTVYF